MYTYNKKSTQQARQTAKPKAAKKRSSYDTRQQMDNQVMSSDWSKLSILSSALRERSERKSSVTQDDMLVHHTSGKPEQSVNIDPQPKNKDALSDTPQLQSGNVSSKNVIQGKFSIQKIWNERVKNQVGLSQVQINCLTKLCDIEDIAEYAFQNYFPDVNVNYILEVKPGANAEVIYSNNPFVIYLGEDLVLHFSTGELLGFINHEISVHPSPTYLLQNQQPETNLPNISENDKQHFYAAGLIENDQRRGIIYGTSVANAAIDMIFFCKNAMSDPNCRHYDQTSVNLLQNYVVPPWLYDTMSDMIAFYLFDISRIRFEKIVNVDKGSYEDAVLKINELVPFALGVLENFYQIALAEAERIDSDNTINSYYILLGLKENIINKLNAYFEWFKIPPDATDVNDYGALGMINARVGKKVF